METSFAEAALDERRAHGRSGAARPGAVALDFLRAECYRRARTGATAAFLAFYVLLAVLLSLTRQPWSDEGSFASPAYNLAFHGFMGTTLVDEQSSGLRGINRHTYWNPPVGILLQALSFRLLGFHLLSIRLPSILMGLVAGLSWFVILERVTGRRAVACLAALFVMTDYAFLMAVSSARYDMICAGFGAAGLALYLTLRERSLGAALLLSNAAIAASGLSHPLGIVYLFGLALLVLARDRPRLDCRRLGLALVPYAVGGAAWGLYILKDPSGFLSQFLFNLGVGNRGQALLHPATALWTELGERYLRAFGLKGHTPGNTGPIYLKAIILAVYAAGLAGSLAIPAVRRSRGFGTVFGLLAVVFLFLTFGEGQRGAVYLIHALPLYASVLAFFVEWLLDRGRAAASIAMAAITAFLALQAGGAVLRASQDTYGRRYDPGMTYVREHAGPGETVMGSVACAFGVGLDRGLLSDNLLGYYSGKVPDWVIVDDFFRESFEYDAVRRPCMFRHVQEVLRRCDKVFDRDGVEVYRLRPPPSPGPPQAPTPPATARSQAPAGAPRTCRSTGRRTG
jgi:Dolichyl-phosphate-mannose-protein mannosyltransferase